VSAAAEPLAAVVEAVVARPGRRYPQIAVGAARGDDVCTAGFGHAEPPTAGTLFEIGSITKVFTATLLALMAGAGEVALDDPVDRFLPDGVRLPVRGRPITLADLATHSSGLPRLPKGLLRMALWKHRANPYAAFTVDQLHRAVREARLKREPGRRARYSNFGVGLLGYALARRAGTTYGELVRARICEPLGLVDTFVDVPPERRDRLADGHGRRGKPVSHWDLPTLAGAGALKSTVDDMLRFLALQQDAGDGPLARAARATHVPRLRRLRLEHCLGWVALGSRAGRRVYWHDGGTGGFRSFCAFTLDPPARVVVLASSARSVTRLGFRLIGELSGVRGR
jgi:CubicO group peptidase (beta-lactamase class C family)